LDGGSGLDILIGGVGKDDLRGGKDDDLSIGGFTAFDSDRAALALLMAQWNSGDSYTDRVDHLRNGTGSILGGTGLKLVATGPDRTVFDDGDKDKLKGDQGRDWFFADLDGVDGDDDKVKDKKWDELLDVIFDFVG